ncbi:hypothetical protein ACEPPN_019472 [Leptodophora sp. 'Broadleaf-Isolate-01']
MSKQDPNIMGNQITPKARGDSTFKALEECDVTAGVVLRFTSLQLQRIGELQVDLLGLQERAAMGTEGGLEESIDKTLQRYVDALRNYETLSQNSLQSFPPNSRLLIPRLSDTAEPGISLSKWFLTLPVRLTGDYDASIELRDIAKGIFKKAKTPSSWRQREEGRIPSCLADRSEKAEDITPSSSISWLQTVQKKEGITPSRSTQLLETKLRKLGLRELDRKRRQDIAQKSALSSRLVMALFGGIALIAPMLVMVFHPSRSVSLITSSLATFLFAIILAFGARDSTGKDVLAATAAYTAVLVVFVGTSMTTSTTG